MKNSATVLADAPTTSLKLAYSYLMPALDIPSKPGNQRHISNNKTSPYKSLFVVDPTIKNATAWDAEWFSNYE